MIAGVNELRIAVEAVADGVILADTRSGEVYINRAARAMLGIPSDAAVDTTYLDGLIGFERFDLAAETSERGSARREIRIADRVLHSVITPLRNAGHPIGMLVVLRDLGGMRDISLHRAEVAQIVSHALRDPLTSITGTLGLLLSSSADPLSERQLRYVAMLRQAATQMTQIIDQLLDLARAQAGAIAISVAPVQLDRLVGEVIDRHRGAASDRQLAIAPRTSAGDISILGDARRLSQALENLLDHAIQFAPAGGVIDVQVFRPTSSEDMIGVSVYSSGELIAPEDLEHLLDPFSISSQHVGGTALGLQIARAIVEAHGGRLWVEPGAAGAAGAKLVFTLPVSPGGDKVAPPDTVEAPRSGGLGESSSVLVIDDDPSRALQLEALLAPLADRVHVANELDGALALARAEHPTLCVVAGAMPGVDDLLSVLEHDPDTTKTAVMVVGDSGRRAGLIAAGADDVLDLPIQPAMFREACCRLIESSRREVPRVLLVDDDPFIRTLCHDMLEVDYQVREVGSANAALSEARRFRPDLIILDVIMPGIDGFRCAEMLRDDASTRSIPFMFLSARVDAADKTRAFNLGAEDYIVKPFDEPEMLARVSKALGRREREFSATTKLPGPRLIQAETEQRLARGDPDAVICYVDLDNLKAFNDYYSWANANAVIGQTADVIRAKINQHGNPGDFIGHIAGDDFVFITSAECVDAVCLAICDRFDHVIRYFYKHTDRESGFIEAKDRFGTQRRFPIMSVSIAAISISKAKTYAALAELSAEGKRLAKAIPGSSYVRDGQVILPREFDEPP
jgi:signal transduction histidine kinase/PleD family two-component response regulator